MSYSAVLEGAGWKVDPIVNPKSGMAAPGYKATLTGSGWVVDPIPKPSAPLDSQIAALYAAGEDGAWYDLSDLTTLFQDTAGTTPVTAAGQPVGRISDKSGRGRHLIAADSATRRPTYGTAGALRYIAFDGVDDGMEATGMASIVSVVLAPYVNAGAAPYACLARLSSTADSALIARLNETTTWRNDGPATLAFDDGTNMRINGAATRDFAVYGAPKVLSARKTTSVTTTILHLGDNAQGVDVFTGRLYGAFIALSRQLTTQELALAENYVASKAGVTF